MKKFCKIACLTIAASASLTLNADYKFSAITNASTGATATTILVPDGSPVVTEMVLTNRVEGIVSNIVEDIAIEPGNYVAVSNAAMNAVQSQSMTNYATRAEIEDGWWSEWTCDPRGSMNPDTLEYETYSVQWKNGHWQLYQGEYSLSEFPTVADEDASRIEFMDAVGESITTATRHLVAAPVPTKPEDIGAQAALTFDTAPTANSTNPVTSGGIKTALDGKASTADATLTPQFGEWTFSNVSDGITDISQPKIVGTDEHWLSSFRYDGYSLNTDAIFNPDPSATELNFTYTDEGLNLHYTANRTVIGYTLGSQTNEVLQPAGDYPTKSDMDKGWWSEWTVTAIPSDFPGSIESVYIVWYTSAEAIEKDLTSGEGWYFENPFSAVWGGNDNDASSIAAIGGWAASRHKVGAPVPTKPSDIGAASVADATLTPVFSDKWDIVDESYFTNIEWSDANECWMVDTSDGDRFTPAFGGRDYYTTSLEDSVYYFSAFRTIIGYTLGSQSEKPLQPKGDYATTADLEGIDKLTIVTQNTSLIFSTNDVGGAVFGGMRDAGGGEIVVDQEIIEGSHNAVSGGAVYTGLATVREEIASVAQNATNYTDDAIAPLCTTQAVNELFGNSISRTKGSITSAGVITDYLLNTSLIGGIRIRYSSHYLDNYTYYGYAGVTACRNTVSKDYTYDDTSTGFARLGDLASISNLVNSKQDALVAGSNISITTNANGEAVISATGSAGGGSSIDIDGSVIENSTHAVSGGAVWSSLQNYLPASDASNFAQKSDLSVTNDYLRLSGGLVAGANIKLVDNGDSTITINSTGGGSAEPDGTPEIVYKSNAIVNSTNTVVLTDNAYNNVTQGEESVLKIQIPDSTGMRSRVFYLVYNCSNAVQTELFFDINTLVTKILVKDGDLTVFSPSVGTNIYKFEEIASEKFLLSRTVAVEL